MAHRSCDLPYCHSDQVIKGGHTETGKQRYRLPTDDLSSPFLRVGARLQRSLTAGQRTNHRYGAQRQWHRDPPCVLSQPHDSD